MAPAPPFNPFQSFLYNHKSGADWPVCDLQNHRTADSVVHNVFWQAEERPSTSNLDEAPVEGEESRDNEGETETEEYEKPF